jgi:hypothetical protein
LNWLPSSAGVPLLSMVSFVFVCILEHSVFHLILATVTPHLVYHVARLVVGLRGAKPRARLAQLSFTCKAVFLENNFMSNFMSGGESHVLAASPCA